MSKIKNINRFTAQEVLNMKSDFGRQKWGHYPFSESPAVTGQIHFGQRYDWIKSSSSKGNVNNCTTVSGSPLVTVSSDNDFPKKYQLLSGTGISTDPIPTVTTKTGHRSFTMSENATASGTVTISYWDADPGEITAGYKVNTRSVECSNTKKIHMYNAVASYISFSTSAENIAATEMRQDSSDAADVLTGASQAGSLHIPGGYWVLDVPQLGPTIYFNFIPHYNWYNGSGWIRILLEEPTDV